tara:strand:+ start:41 stop:259 length:219 start_codon:yes stop_codon:yes gene_type:complete
MALLIQADLVSPTSAAIFWRDAELLRTDVAATVSDYPNAEAILVYRQALRNWPAKNEDGEYINGFPTTRPEL